VAVEEEIVHLRLPGKELLFELVFPIRLGVIGVADAVVHVHDVDVRMEFGVKRRVGKIVIGVNAEGLAGEFLRHALGDLVGVGHDPSDRTDGRWAAWRGRARGRRGTGRIAAVIRTEGEHDAGVLLAELDDGAGEFIQRLGVGGAHLQSEGVVRKAPAVHKGEPVRVVL